MANPQVNVRFVPNGRGGRFLVRCLPSRRLPNRLILLFDKTTTVLSVEYYACGEYYCANLLNTDYS